MRPPAHAAFEACLLTSSSGRAGPRPAVSPGCRPPERSSFSFSTSSWRLSIGLSSSRAWVRCRPRRLQVHLLTLSVCFQCGLGCGQGRDNSERGAEVRGAELLHVQAGGRGSGSPLRSSFLLELPSHLGPKTHGPPADVRACLSITHTDLRLQTRAKWLLIGLGVAAQSLFGLTASVHFPANLSWAVDQPCLLGARCPAGWLSRRLVTVGWAEGPLQKPRCPGSRGHPVSPRRGKGHRPARPQERVTQTRNTGASPCSWTCLLAS